MLVPSQYFMNNFEQLNMPKKTTESESEFFDCNPGKKELVDSMAFE